MSAVRPMQSSQPRGAEKQLQRAKEAEEQPGDPAELLERARPKQRASAALASTSTKKAIPMCHQAVQGSTGEWPMLWQSPFAAGGLPLAGRGVGESCARI